MGRVKAERRLADTVLTILTLVGFHLMQLLIKGEKRFDFVKGGRSLC